MADHQQVIATASMNGAATVAVISSILGWLPPFISLMASAAGLLLFCVQLWESKTVQNWYERRKSRRSP